MSAANRNRARILADLLRLEKPPMEMARVLAGIPWDIERPLVVLARGDVRRVLQRAIDGRTPATYIEAWADLIEGREDIGREPGSEAVLNEAIFELANPELTGMRLENLIRKWLDIFQ